MEEMIPCAVKDQEVFQRVWQRVMAGRDDAQCPIEALSQGDLSCGCLEALARRQGEGLPPECGGREQAEEPPAQQPGWQPAEDMPQAPGGDRPAPEPPTPEPQPPAAGTEQPPEALSPSDGASRDSDLPQPWEDPRQAPDRTARLRQQVMEALEGWQFYRHLARRVKGGETRVLNSLAGELHRQARKLSAAYFLLTGLRYWPSELLATPAIPSYWGALRQRHQAEQRQETAFRLAADDWDDPGLQELYAELVDGCQQRCRQLRALLERDEA